MNRNIIIGIVVLIILVGGGFWFMRSQQINDVDIAPTQNDQSSMTAPTQEPSMTTSTDSAQSAKVKEFTVTGSPFKFDLAQIKVNEGDTVKITFKNSAGTHDFRLDEFNVATKVLQAGQKEIVQFVASKKGTFEYYCSVGNHRAMGMKGSLIVE